MARRFTLRIGNHLQAPGTKRYYNQQVFAEIAPKYDFITRALSFGRDTSWKRDLVASLPSCESPLCLDLACGTGGITFLLARKYPRGLIVGLDITEPMLERARQRNTFGNVRFLNQDMGGLEFPAGTVDIVTGGYALRNAPDLEVTVQEIHRVLKPHGMAAFLDFSKPGGRFAQRLEYWILKVWTGFWGTLLHRNHEVYGYIAESLQCFPDRLQLRDLFRDKGFTVVASRLYFFGITELLVVRKAGGPS
jgi:demethylmenaquinone methyltransferase/2-methoxy-6-polyprenyl-1,4-benzoquinol methylase